MNRMYVRRGNMDQLKSLLPRPKFYNNIDGMGELGRGIVSLGFAIILWLSIGMPVDSIWNRMDLSMACYILIFIAIDYGIKAIKKRITYPRTGFVEYRKPLPFWAALILIIGLGTLLNVGEKYLDRWQGEIESRPLGHYDACRAGRSSFCGVLRIRLCTDCSLEAWGGRSTGDRRRCDCHASRGCARCAGQEFMGARRIGI